MPSVMRPSLLALVPLVPRGFRVARVALVALAAPVALVALVALAPACVDSRVCRSTSECFVGELCLIGAASGPRCVAAAASASDASERGSDEGNGAPREAPPAASPITLVRASTEALSPSSSGGTFRLRPLASVAVRP